MNSMKASKDINSAPTQQKVLISIFEASPDGARLPTLRDLTVGAKSNISRVLDQLEEKGYVERERAESSSARSRGFWLTKKALVWLRAKGYDTSNYIRAYLANDDIRVVPLLGEVAAGNPISPDSYLSDEDVDQHVPLPARNLPIGPIFMLRVRGESMTGDHIIDGDQVIVVPYSDRPKGNGEIVVALIDGDATVKHLEIRDGKYHFEGSGPEYYQRTEEPENVHIQGRVIGILRIGTEGL
jgi:repressor LexA